MLRRLGMVLMCAAVLVGTLGAAPISAQADPVQRAPAFHSDPLVIGGLVTLTATLTGTSRARVDAHLAAGASVESIAVAGGSSAAAVLARFDTMVDRTMARAAASGRLPQSVANARAAWFKQSARLQIAEPGLAPRFPGLHELHVVMISAAVDTSGIRRAEVRKQLESCATLSEIVAKQGKSGADVAAAAMGTLHGTLDMYVATGTLSQAQRDSWTAALQKATLNMTNTHGLHVAGKECAVHSM